MEVHKCVVYLVDQLYVSVRPNVMSANTIQLHWTPWKWVDHVRYVCSGLIDTAYDNFQVKRDTFLCRPYVISRQWIGFQNIWRLSIECATLWSGCQRNFTEISSGTSVYLCVIHLTLVWVILQISYHVIRSTPKVFVSPWFLSCALLASGKFNFISTSLYNVFYSRNSQDSMAISPQALKLITKN